MSATDFVVVWLPIIALALLFVWFITRSRKTQKLNEKAVESNDEIVRQLKEIKTLLQDRKE